MLAGLRQGLDQQEDIGGTAPRHGGYGIEERPVLDPSALADRGKQRPTQAALFPRDQPVRAGDRDAPADAGRRVWHSADDSGLAEVAPYARHRGALRDRQNER